MNERTMSSSSSSSAVEASFDRTSFRAAFRAALLDFSSQRVLQTPTLVSLDAVSVTPAPSAAPSASASAAPPQPRPWVNPFAPSPPAPQPVPWVNPFAPAMPSPALAPAPSMPEIRLPRLRQPSCLRETFSQAGLPPLGTVEDLELSLLSSLTSQILTHSSSSPPPPLHSSSTSALFQSIRSIGLSSCRLVCQYHFRKNDIVWVCKTCQSDETCVLCNDCFAASNHASHDVYFYHAMAGGCCDCGDSDAWDPAGFCHRHGPEAVKRAASGTAAGGDKPLSDTIIAKCREAAEVTADWLANDLRDGVLMAFSSLDEKDEPDAAAAAADVTHSTTTTTTTSSSEDEDSASEDDQPLDSLLRQALGGFLPDANRAVAEYVARERRARRAAEKARRAASVAPKVLAPRRALLDVGSRSGIKDAEGGGVFLTMRHYEVGKDREDANNYLQVLHDALSKLRALCIAETKKRRRGGGFDATTNADSIAENAEIAAIFQVTDLVGTREKALKELLREGELVLLGSREFEAAMGRDVFEAWIEGSCDQRKAEDVDGFFRSVQSIFSSAGLIICLKTRQELLVEQRASTLLTWLHALANSCDPLCQQVCSGFDVSLHVSPLFEIDLKLAKTVANKLHSLLLTLLAVPSFKWKLAHAYCDTYEKVTRDYAKGIGVAESSPYSLSVQFLNRANFVKTLSTERGMLGLLVDSLSDAFLSSTETSKKKRPQGSVGPRHQLQTQVRKLNLSSPFMYNRRYVPIISDLKCVLNVATVPRLLLTSKSHLSTWMKSLELLQCMDPHAWRPRTMNHVLHEPRTWMNAFNAAISISGLFEKMACWYGEPDVADYEQLVTVSVEILKTIHEWQLRDRDNYKATIFSALLSPDDSAPVALPMSSVSASMGCLVALPALPIAQTKAFSFHPLMHRFAAACLRNCAYLVKNGLGSVLRACEDFESSIGSGSNDRDGDGSSLTDPHLSTPGDAEAPSTSASNSFGGAPGFSFGGFDSGGGSDVRSEGGAVDGVARKQPKLPTSSHVPPPFWSSLAEYPLIALSRAAQIRVGIWRRNGMMMSEQVMNYYEPHFCKMFRDSDIFMLQFAALKYHRAGRKAGSGYFINLLLHRFGCFDFCGLKKAHELFPAKYHEGVAGDFFGAELASEKRTSDETLQSSLSEINTSTSSLYPWVYTPAADSQENLRLLEEMLHLLIIVIVEVPPLVTGGEELALVKARLRREVVHRLASGSCTHSALSEVYNMLSSWESAVLQKYDTTAGSNSVGGAALDEILEAVGDRRATRDLDPDKWALKPAAWKEYDPAFWHVPSKSHQSASEQRPAPPLPTSSMASPQAYCPILTPCHEIYWKLRKDLLSDATLLQVMWRTLWDHFGSPPQSASHGLSAASRQGEVVLGRVVHLLTLGACAWGDSSASGITGAGTGEGGVFYAADEEDYGSGESPTLEMWIESYLLADAAEITMIDADFGKGNILSMLKKLATIGESKDGSFVVQDKILQSGASWLCDFASKNSKAAKKMLSGDSASSISETESSLEPTETDLDRRKREAKERAMKFMKKQSASFASSLLDIGADDGGHGDGEDDASSGAAGAKSSKLDKMVEDDERKIASSSSPASRVETTSPMCIICTEDSSAPEKGALGYCSFVQASTVLLGGERATKLKLDSIIDSKFVGCHVSLCGHAVHNSCFDKYFATLSARELNERPGVVTLNLKGGEFYCPLCKQLSNSLVPYVELSDNDTQAGKEGDQKRQLQADKMDEESDDHDSDVYADTDYDDEDDTDEFEDALDELDGDGGDGSVAASGVGVGSSSPSRSSGKMKRARMTQGAETVSRSLGASTALADPPQMAESDSDKLWSRYSKHLNEVVAAADAKRGLHSNSSVGEWMQCVSAFCYSICSEGDSCISDFLNGVFTVPGVEGLWVKNMLVILSAGTKDSSSIFEGKFGKLRVLGAALCKAALTSSTLSNGQSTLPRLACLKESGASNTIPSILESFSKLCTDKPMMRCNLLVQTAATMCMLRGNESKEAVPLIRCVNAIAIGLRARIVQVIIGSTMQMMGSDASEGGDSAMMLRYTTKLQAAASKLLEADAIPKEEQFFMDCALLLKDATRPLASMEETISAMSFSDAEIVDVVRHLKQAIRTAATLGLRFLCEVVLVLQILLPDASRSLGEPPNEDDDFDGIDDSSRSLIDACAWLGIEPYSSLSPPTARAAIGEFSRKWVWEVQVFPHLALFGWGSGIQVLKEECKRGGISPDLGAAALERGGSASMSSPPSSPLLSHRESSFDGRDIVPFFGDWGTGQLSWNEQDPNVDIWSLEGARSSSSSSAAAAATGGGASSSSSSSASFVVTGDASKSSLLQISRLPSLPVSYTDLYSSLTASHPDSSDHLAICLVCGTVLNAQGKGQCTAHSQTCGGGCGIFFLLQECAGLLMHGEKAVYMQSCYVDAHGETPHYRGRPLFLDKGRWRLMKKMWENHEIRRKVATDRRYSKQFIIAGYY